MPSPSFVLGSSATFVSLLSLISAPVLASPLTFLPPSSTSAAVTSSVVADDAWANWGASSTLKFSTSKTTTPSALSDPVWDTWGTSLRSSSSASTVKSTISSKSTDPIWTNWATTTSRSSTRPAASTTPGSVTWGGWTNDFGTCGSLKTTSAQSCTTPSPSVSKCCSTYHLETPVASCTTWHAEVSPYSVSSSCTSAYPARSTCTDVKSTPTPVCAVIPIVLSASCGTSSSCTTPAPKPTSSCTTYHRESGIASCSTWHIETAGYPITSSCSTSYPVISSCSTVTPTPTPVCAIVTTTLIITSTITDRASVTTKPVINCTTPISTVTSCATYHLETSPYPITSTCATTKITQAQICSVVPITNNWNDWSSTLTSVRPTITSSSRPSSCIVGSTVTSCSTYHLETAGYPVTSTCSTYTVIPSAKCTPVPVSGTASSWGAWNTTATAPAGIKTFTGTAADKLSAAGAIVIAAAGVMLL